MNQDPTPGQ